MMDGGFFVICAERHRREREAKKAEEKRRKEIEEAEKKKRLRKIRQSDNPTISLTLSALKKIVENQ